MNHEWVPQTPGELRRHAAKLQAIAALVHRPDVASHLREHAAALLAEAELMAVADHDWCPTPLQPQQVSRQWMSRPGRERRMEPG